MESSKSIRPPDMGMDNTLSKSVDACPPADTSDPDLSPKSKENFRYILDILKSQDAFFGEDASGRPTIEYRKEKVLYSDKSEANKIQTARVYNSQEETENKKKLLVDAALEHIQYLKQNISPQGVVLDRSKLVPSKKGYYEEWTEFTRTKDILGKGNTAGNIVVIRDNTTSSPAALKTIMISVFRKEEIQAWVDLDDTGYVPHLYLFKLNGNKVDIFMEPLKEAVSLTSIIDEYMWKIREANPALVKPFSLYMFHGLMTAAQTMHDRGWTHRDLHSGNIMVQKGSGVNIPLRIKILDFGNAVQLDKGGLKGFRMDIAEIVRKFTAMYLGNEFESEADIRKEDRAAELEELADLLKISREERKEMFKLIDTALQITSAPDFQDFRHQLKDKLLPQEDMHEILKKVISLLFPPSEKEGGLSSERLESEEDYTADGAGAGLFSKRSESESEEDYTADGAGAGLFSERSEPEEDYTVADCADKSNIKLISDDVLRFFRESIRIG